MRNRCNMNHAVFWLTPTSRPISQLLTPFLQLTSIQSVGSHLSKPIGLSSKRLPTLTENCFLQPRHFHNLRVARKPTLSDAQRGHTTPSGHRSRARNPRL